MAYGTNVSTPLLLLYQDRLDLSAWTVTALFAAYPIGLIPALLLGGPASDLRGRRRTTLPFVALNPEPWWANSDLEGDVCGNGAGRHDVFCSAAASG